MNESRSYYLLISNNVSINPHSIVKPAEEAEILYHFTLLTFLRCKQRLLRVGQFSCHSRNLVRREFQIKQSEDVDIKITP